MSTNWLTSFGGRRGRIAQGEVNVPSVPFRKEEDGAGRRGCARDDVWRQRGHYVRRSSRRSHIGRPSRPLFIDYRRRVKIFFQKKKRKERKKENKDVSRNQHDSPLFDCPHFFLFFSFSGNNVHPFAHGRGVSASSGNSKWNTHAKVVKEKKKISTRLWCLWKRRRRPLMQHKITYKNC